MTDAQRVKSNPRFINNYVSSGNKRVVVLQSKWPFPKEHFYGHTWTEAFRKAALHLVTQRVTQ